MDYHRSIKSHDIEQMGYYNDDRIYVPIPHIEY